jgi:hypothetical protein
MRGRDRCTLLINPADAAGVGLRSGDLAQRDRGGQRRGHGRCGLPTARVRPRPCGYPDGPPALIDVPSNTQVANGVPCTAT